MKLTPLQRRAERRSRNQSSLDMNLVSLIDVFTILIFFLLSNVSGGAEPLQVPKGVHLPESTSQKSAREALVVSLDGDDIRVQGRAVARASEAMQAQDDVIGPLKAALEAAAPGGVVPAALGASSAAAPMQALTILGDKTVPYQLLRKVMATAARANFTDVSFAVRRKGQA